MIPIPTPLAMDSVYGIMIAVSTAGIDSVWSSHCMLTTLLIIKQATNNKAGAVANCGIVLASGEKNKASKKKALMTQEVSPVRPPARMPAALSRYGLGLEVPKTPAAMAVMLFARRPLDTRTIVSRRSINCVC